MQKKGSIKGMLRHLQQSKGKGSIRGKPVEGLFRDHNDGKPITVKVSAGKFTCPYSGRIFPLRNWNYYFKSLIDVSLRTKTSPSTFDNHAQWLEYTENKDRVNGLFVQGLSDGSEPYVLALDSFHGGTTSAVLSRFPGARVSVPNDSPLVVAALRKKFKGQPGVRVYCTRLRHMSLAPSSLDGAFLDFTSTWPKVFVELMNLLKGKVFRPGCILAISICTRSNDPDFIPSVDLPTEALYWIRLFYPESTLLTVTRYHMMLCIMYRL